MSIFLSSPPNKPNRTSLTYSEKNNDINYHLDWAKWAVMTSSMSGNHTKWLDRIKDNKNFYKGDQWQKKEDIQTFLMDSTGATTNRIQFKNNVIRPMVEQFRGNASRLKINASAKSISKLSINRRELALSKKIFKTKLANEFPGLASIMKINEPDIGENEQETTQIFENLYVDLYTAQINSLIKYVRELNELDQTQIKISLNLALSGLCAIEAYDHAGDQRYRVVESEDFGWDKDARRPDLEDGTYKWYQNPMDAASMAEIYPEMKHEDVKAIEAYTSTESESTMTIDQASTRVMSNSRVPVYKVFWKDFDNFEFGYVEDEYGYPYLTRINYKYDGEDEPRYIDSDLITPPDSPENRRLFKNGKKKRSSYAEYLRYCVFVPGELIGRKKDEKMKETSHYDIYLEGGIVEYQETEINDISNVKFPIKCQTWGYIDGEIFSPIDDAIDPQRFINRVLSVTEQHINSSGGQGIIIDEDAIEPGSQDQIYRDIKEGRPVTVRGRGKGIPNLVGSYDSTPGQGVYSMFNIIPMIGQMIQDTSGVNEPLKGESTGSDQLVGVTQLLIQQGSLMQEPFYAAIGNLYVQVHQHTATVGKRRYIDNERELAVIAGDDGLEVLTLAKDLRNEDFRVFVTRENNDEFLKSQANQMLQIFYEMQLIDDKVFSNLYDRSTPDEVTKALRSQAGIRLEAAKQKAKQEQAMAQQQEQQAMGLMERDRNDKLNAQAQQERIQDKTNASKERQKAGELNMQKLKIEQGG